MDIEIEIQNNKLLFMKNIERIKGYIERHKRISVKTIRVTYFEGLIINEQEHYKIEASEQNIRVIHIENEKNVILIYIDIMPITEMIFKGYINSEGIIRKIELEERDDYFRVDYIHLKMKIITPIKETTKKRYSWFNR